MKTTLQYFIFMMIITTSTNHLLCSASRNQSQSLLKELDQYVVKRIIKIHANTAANGIIQVRKESQLSSETSAEYLNKDKENIHTWCKSRGYEINRKNLRLSSCHGRYRHPAYLRRTGMKTYDKPELAYNIMVQEWNTASSVLDQENYAQKLIKFGVLTKINAQPQPQTSSKFTLENYIQATGYCIQIHELPITIPHAFGNETTRCSTRQLALKKTYQQWNYAQQRNKTHCKKQFISCDNCSWYAAIKYAEKLTSHGIRQQKSS